MSSPAVNVPSLAVTEPTATAVLLCVLGLLIAISVLFSRTMDRLGVPVVLLFLMLGMLGGSEGLGGVAFDDYAMTVRIGTIALVLILFDGGLNTSGAVVRRVWGPASLLATVGVAITAGVIALFARLFGLGWSESLLLGAVVSSTDAAAVFAVLRSGSLRLEPKLGGTVEVESCVNDPMAVILTTALIGVIQAGGSPGWALLWYVPLQLVVGVAVGTGLGFLCRDILRKVPLSTVGLYPALTLSIAFISFGIATLLQGSGFLAVFVTALILGNGPLAYRNGLRRIHDALAWLAQIGVFLMLGLLVFPSDLPGVALAGLGVGLVLTFVARPLAAAACLFPFRYPARHVGYVGWVGLRGAVPIILATFPVLAGVQGAERLFNLVFFVVVVSSIVPGATIRMVTRALGLQQPWRPTPSAALEVNTRRPLDGLIESYYIDGSLPVAGSKLSQIDLPESASVLMLVRGEDLIPARGGTTLNAGDHAYVFFRPEDQPKIERIFISR